MQEGFARKNVFFFIICRELGKYARMKWKEVQVGDLVHLSCDEMIPADILVLRTNDSNGLCYIETSNLDGESNLKQREVIRGFVERVRKFSQCCTSFHGMTILMTP